MEILTYKVCFFVCATFSEKMFVIVCSFHIYILTLCNLNKCMVLFLKKVVMKNFVWIVIGVCSFFCYSTLMSTTVGKQVGTVVNLSDVEALASGEELPEVVITCGSPEEKGQCWKGECDNTCFTPFGFYRCWECPTATGNPKDVCIDDVPCW